MVHRTGLQNLKAVGSNPTRPSSLMCFRRSLGTALDCQSRDEGSIPFGSSIPPSSSGRTTDSDSVNGGSNPSGGSTL